MIDGGGLPLASGSAGFVQVPFDSTFYSWNLIADLSGTCTIDVRRSTYNSWTGSGLSSANSIVSTDVPKITNSFKAQNLNVTLWNVVGTGDILEFYVSGVTTNITRATINLGFYAN